MKKSSKYILMFGHICTDISQGALPAILPFLIASRGIGYASAATLIFAANLVSSVMQPLFGFLGDRRSMPWLMSLGILLAGSGVALIGYAYSFTTVCLAAALSGLGIALFHPEGGKLANRAAGEKKGTGISIFAVGGNIGMAIGPVMASAALLYGGLQGTVVFVVPALAMAIVSQLFVRRLKKEKPPEAEAPDKTVEKKPEPADDWRSFARIAPVIFFRSIVFYGLMTFIPIYWVDALGQTEGAASSVLAMFSVVGIAGTLIGGRLADRFGFRRIIVICCLALAPLLVLMLQTGSSLAALIILIPISFAMACPYSTMVAWGQSFLPNHIGLASGITMGLTVSVGGICAPVIGWAGDKFGLMTAMYVLAGAALVTLLLSLILPGRSSSKKAKAQT